MLSACQIMASVKLFMDSKNLVSGSLQIAEEQSLKEDAIWLNSQSQEAVQPSLSASLHLCEHYAPLGNRVFRKGESNAKKMNMGNVCYSAFHLCVKTWDKWI